MASDRATFAKRSGAGTDRTSVSQAARLLTLLPALLSAAPSTGRARYDRLRRLDLGDGQIERIRSIVHEHRPLLLDETDELTTARTALMDRVRDEIFDAEELRAVHAWASEAELALAFHTAELLREIREVLTPEQRAAATEILRELEELAAPRPSAPREPLVAAQFNDPAIR